jgi:hydroxymethylpyrimidine pyrophosphatase-like HAD family hydrolase
MAALMECLGRSHLHLRPDYLVLVEREIYRHEETRYVSVEEWNQTCRDAHDELFRRVSPDLPEIVGWINDRFDATLYEDGYSPLCMIAGSPEDADAIMEHLESYCRSTPPLTVVRNDVYARFSHADFSKGTALAEIQRQLGLNPEATLAAGDHFNDLPMLSREHAHHLIAPANAIPSVRDQVIAQGGYVSPLPCGLGILDGLRRLLSR